MIGPDSAAPTVTPRISPVDTHARPSVRVPGGMSESINEVPPISTGEIDMPETNITTARSGSEFTARSIVAAAPKITAASRNRRPSARRHCRAPYARPASRLPPA